MQVKTQPIALPAPQPGERIVKRGAVLAFRAFFALAEQARKAPGVLAQASVDIREAWEETSRPNA